MDSTVALLNTKAIKALAEGRQAEAIGILRELASLQPLCADHLVNLAVVLRGHAPAAERIELYRRALSLAPGDLTTLSNLSAVLNDAGNFDEAETYAGQALLLNAAHIDARLNLASALAGQRRWQEAVREYDLVLQQVPDSVPVLHSAARVSRSARQLDAAQRYLRKGLDLLARSGRQGDAAWQAALTLELGQVYSDAGLFAEAEPCLRSAVQHSPADVRLLLLLGDAVYGQGRIEDALHLYEHARTLAPDKPAVHLNIGIALHGLGLHEQALAAFMKVLELDPDGLPAYSNIGTCLTYATARSPTQLKQLYDEMDRRIMAPLRESKPFANQRVANRPLRVGYLSADFRQHPVAYFALPLLQGHRRESVEVCCYYNHRQQDEWTQRFRHAATLWRDCVDMTDAELAERIREDRIDILVDLSGHTQGHRLFVFARKPAPVQVSWMGYVTTTGLSAMDYRLTHEDVDPSGVDGDYSERLVRLPGSLWCYRPLPGMPEPAPAPVLRNGYVTFASFNRFSKVSDAVLDCWCAILARVPESRLWLCIPEGETRARVAGRFATAGIEAGRLNFFGHLPHQEFWALHAKVDIALDPFPFNGGTTTCETLWLGVPLISCSGGDGSFAPRFASRMGKAMLRAVGLGQLATDTEAAYIEKAVWLANQSALLDTMRQELRPRMLNSALLDETGFLQDVEAAYRRMWCDWLSASQHTGCSTDG